MSATRRSAALPPLELRVTGGRVPTAPSTVHERRGPGFAARSDQLALEEPLEVRVATPAACSASGQPETSTLSITMRTPGHDFELVTGFLLSEGVITSSADLHKVAYCLNRDVESEQRYNIVTADLTVAPRRVGLERHVVTSSACGVCGSASIESVRLAGHPELESGPSVDVSLLARLPDLLAAGQRGFAATGGLHGAALVASDGTVLALREDVGRHNAVDKVIGWALLEDLVPLRDKMLIVSGRISFEIVQKALQAGIAFVAAVSAATSLAARLASETGMTLVGFVRGDRFTVYSGRERIVLPPGEQ